MAALSGATLCTCERLSRDGSAWLPRRGVHALHMVFLFRLSPKVAKNHNVALSVFSHIFLRTDTQSCRKHVFGRSRHIMWQKWQVSAGKTMTFACVFAWLLPHALYP